MKKIILFVATVVIVFCINPIVTTQATVQNAQNIDNFVTCPANNIPEILNQKELCNMNVGLSNTVLTNDILTYDMQELQKTTIAQGGTRPVRPGNRNPYVKRRGYGSSDMGDDYEEEGENEGEEEDEDEDEEGLDFGDDSAVEYNRDL